MKVKHCTLQQMNTFQEYRAFKGLENSNGTTSIAANYKQFLKLFLGKKTDYLAIAVILYRHTQVCKLHTQTHASGMHTHSHTHTLAS